MFTADFSFLLDTACRTGHSEKYSKRRKRHDVVWKKCTWL